MHREKRQPGVQGPNHLRPETVALVGVIIPGVLKVLPRLFLRNR